MVYSYDTGYFSECCSLCARRYAKSELDKVMVKYGRYGSPRVLAYVCRECIPKVADFLGAALPDVEGWQRRYENCRAVAEEGE